MLKHWLTAAAIGPTLWALAASAEPGLLQKTTLDNPAAYIPPQCYTRTRDTDGSVHNPCYICHRNSRRPNFVDDDDLQRAFSFAALPQTNHWTNLFKDRRPALAQISDRTMRDYIHTSNYFDVDGRIIPARRLAELPAAWDFNGDGRWQGYLPDAWFRFDADGFDRAPDGIPSGWRAFAYYPLPSTFWPTNGSTSDVLIRLPQAFRTGVYGRADPTVYKTNLAIVEALITERDVAIEPVDEAALGGVDLDRDGRIGRADHIAYDWAPLQKRFMWYVGAALAEQRAGRVHLAAGLYPEGTEFLHTVRYIDVAADGDNRLAPRMKEMRYARKTYWADYATLQAQAHAELKEAHDFPDRLRTIRGNPETGLSNEQGWIYAGMIEDADGALRPQSFEELAFCVGCHSGIGSTRDGIFSFQRRIIASGTFQHGWYHWSQKSLRGTPEQVRSDGEPEYSYYLKHNGAGDEFRSNGEVMRKFFDAHGKPKTAMLERLHRDVSLLLFASKERAMQLNKAYRVTVQAQSFTLGRDAVVAPPANVHRQLQAGATTGITQPLDSH